MRRLTIGNLFRIYQMGYIRTRLRYAQLGFHIALRTFFMLFIGGVSSLTLLLLNNIVDAFEKPVHRQQIVMLALFYGVCWTVGNVMEWTKGIATAFILIKCEASIALDIFSGIINKSHVQQSSLDVGVVVSDLNRAMRSFGAINDSLFWVILPTIFQMIFSFVVIWNKINPFVALLFVLSTSSLFFVAYWASSKSDAFYQRIFAAQNKIFSFFSGYVSNLYDVKINNFEKYAELSASEKLSEYRREVFGANLTVGLLLGLQTLLIGCVVILFSVHTAYNIGYFNLPAGSFVLITGYAIQMTLPFAMIASSLISLKSNFIALNRSFDYISMPGKNAYPVGDDMCRVTDFLRDKTEVFRLSGVVLSKRHALRGPLDWIFETDKTYAVVGPSGAGKTTLIKMMIGLIPIGVGCIYFYGCKVNEAIKHAILEEVAVVPQCVNLFDGDLRDNLIFGTTHEKNSAIVTDVINGLHLSCLDFASNNFSDLNGISGGERQRIGIGRSVLRSKRVMILDEPTSALDGTLEASVLKFLKSRVQTLIIITHRKALINLVDVVYSV